MQNMQQFSNGNHVDIGYNNYIGNNNNNGINGHIMGMGDGSSMWLKIYYDIMILYLFIVNNNYTLYIIFAS